MLEEDDYEDPVESDYEGPTGDDRIIDGDYDSYEEYYELNASSYVDLDDEDSVEEQLEYFEEKEKEDLDFSNKSPEDILFEVFGYTSFKVNQKEIIERILNKEGDTLALMPTGGGKSLCFQIPALKSANLTVVITPLISLMKDQVDALRKKNVPAFFLNSSISQEESNRILSLIQENKVKLLYISPESIKSQRLIDILRLVNIDLFVIDEAHLISSWGQDFRPDYLRLGDVLVELGSPPLLCLTATATPFVQEDIQKNLKRKCKIFKTSFDRSNLYLEVIPLSDNVNKERYLVDLIKNLAGPTLVFVSYTETAENLSKFLFENGLKSGYYHGKMTQNDLKTKIQEDFINDKIDVVVATKAFGMGIDKPNIRNVIHFNIPHSIEDYYQEIGRAGRDEKQSYCITLFSERDIPRLKRLVSLDWPSLNKINTTLRYFKTQSSLFLSSEKLIAKVCDLNETPVKLINYRLQQFGAIKIIPRFLSEMKLEKNPQTINVDKSDTFYDDIEKINSSNYFKNSQRIWVKPQELAERTGFDFFKIKELINHLVKNGIFNIVEEQKTRDLFLIKKSINDFDSKPIATLFERILNNKLNNIDMLVTVFKSDKCIRNAILNHFGEDSSYSCTNCYKCSNILLSDIVPKLIDENHAIDSVITTIKDIELKKETDSFKITLLKSIVLNSSNRSKNFIKILIGNLNVDWAKELPFYNIFEKTDLKKIEDELNSLIKEGLIKHEIDGFLQITKKGIEYLENELPTGAELRGI